MVQSLNTKVDFTIKATSYLGLANYGKIMIGDKAFELYNEKNVKDRFLCNIDSCRSPVICRLFGYGRQY